MERLYFPDTIYLGTTANDVNFTVALNKFGFNLFRIGLHKISLKNALNLIPTLNGKIQSDTKNIKDRNVSLHDSHFHSTNVKLNDGEKNL